MKSIPDILGGSQILLSLNYDIQTVFEDYLSEEHRSFLVLLRAVESDMPCMYRRATHRGRPAYDYLPFFRAFLAQSLLRIATVSDLIKRLGSDRNLRMICGFTRVPSPATFSRWIYRFARDTRMEERLDSLVRTHLSHRIIGHISRDSTAIVAREKAITPTNKSNQPSQIPRKQGRPPKGQERSVHKPSRLERQVSMNPHEALKELNTQCAWGVKTSSQGKHYAWKGYKLNLDMTDCGIPITAVVTAANVHDSQVAIPMEKLTASKVTHLYSLMDSAYDAQEIRDFCTHSGRIALIDANKRRNAYSRQMPSIHAQRFTIRTTIERGNAHLKDWLIPSKLMVKGHAKVRFVLHTAVLVLAAIKIVQYLILPSVQ